MVLTVHLGRNRHVSAHRKYEPTTWKIVVNYIFDTKKKNLKKNLFIHRTPAHPQVLLWHPKGEAESLESHPCLKHPFRLHHQGPETKEIRSESFYDRIKYLSAAKIWVCARFLPPCMSSRAILGRRFDLHIGRGPVVIYFVRTVRKPPI